MKIEKRKIASKIIRLAFLVAGLAVTWQIVRFWQGKIGFPLIDWMMQVMGGHAVDLSLQVPAIDGFVERYGHGIFGQLAAWWTEVVYYVFGTVIWLGLGTYVMILGEKIGRVVAVGYVQFCEESREAAKAQEQLRLREERYWRRHQALVRRRELKEQRESAGGFSVTTLVVGIFIGSWFF